MIELPTYAGRLVPVLTLACTLAYGPLHGQAVAPAAVTVDDDTIFLSPFIVTAATTDGYTDGLSTGATRTRTAVRDLPVQINIITEQLLRDTASFDLDQAVDYLGGVSRFFNEFEPIYNIRGFFSSAAMRNGVRSLHVPDAQFISRIEAVKGPAALLYGQTEPGGVVNYITKRPPSNPRHSVSLSAGNYDFYRAALESGGPLGSGKHFAYHFGAVYHDQGWAPRKQSIRRVSIAPMLQWDLTEATSLLFRYGYQDNNEVPTGGLPFKPGNHPDLLSESPKRPAWIRELGPGYAKDTPASFENFTSHVYELEATHRFSRKTNLRLNLAYHDRSRESVREGATNVNANTYIPGVSGIRDASWIADTRTNTRSAVQTDLVHEFTFSRFGGQLLLGGEFSSQSQEQRGGNWRDPEGRFPTTAPAAGTAGPWVSGANRLVRFRYDVFDPVQVAAHKAFALQNMPNLYTGFFRNETEGVQDVDNYAAYTNLQLFDREQRARLMTGLRWDKVEIDSYTRVAATGQVTTRSTGDAARFTPQAGFSYRLVDAVTVYTLYSRSINPRFSVDPVRSPVAEERLINEAALLGVPAPDPNTLPWGRLRAPEYGQGSEIGFKFDFPQQRLTSTVAFFHIEKRNTVTNHSNPVLQAVGFRETGGLERGKGVDFDMAWSPASGWQVIGGYTYADTVMKISSNQALVGKSLRGAPRHQGSLWAHYRARDGAWKGISGGLGFTGIDARRNDVNAFSWSEGWYRIDARVGYQTRVFGNVTDFGLNVRNLTDRTYMDDRDGFALGRNYTFSVNMQF